MAGKVQGNTVMFDHGDCKHFDRAILLNEHYKGTEVLGWCEPAVERLQLTSNITAFQVVVRDCDFAAEVWLDRAGAQENVVKGCPCFEAAEEALDGIAGDLQDMSRQGQ